MASRFESLPAAPFYFGLALCGLVTCLLGPVLPVLSARWSLTDTQGGSLFAAQFAATTVGAVLSAYSPRLCVALGFAGIAGGMAVLAIGGNYATALLAFALAGLGYGGAVTATNLIFGTEYPERRGSLLTWVNLCWGAGAVAAPELVALAVREDALRVLLLALALCGLVLFAAFRPLLLRANNGERETSRVQDSRTRIGARIFLLFSVVLFLYVGAETAIAGWIATYVHRLGALSVERASLFVSGFWLSVVAGRGLVVLLLHVLAERAVLLGGIVLAMAGVAALLTPRAPETAFAAVVIAGLGCAPIFPLLVSRMLARTGRARQVGWIFAFCGSGGAVVPWITGAVSQYSGGLRAAFVTPLAALGAILVCVLIESAMGVATGKPDSGVIN